MSKQWGTSNQLEYATTVDALNQDFGILQFETFEPIPHPPSKLYTIAEKDLLDPRGILANIVLVASNITKNQGGSMGTVWQRIQAEHQPRKSFQLMAIQDLCRAANRDSLNGYFEEGTDGLYRLRLISADPIQIEFSADVPYVWLTAQKIMAEGVDFLNFEVMARLHKELGDADLIILATMLNTPRGAVAPKKQSRERKSSQRAILSDFVEHGEVSNLFIWCKKYWNNSLKKNIPMEQIYHTLLDYLKKHHVGVRPQPMLSLTESTYPTALLANAYEAWLASLKNRDAQKPENRRFVNTLSTMYPLLAVDMPLYFGFTKTITAS